MYNTSMTSYFSKHKINLRYVQCLGTHNITNRQLTAIINLIFIFVPVCNSQYVTTISTGARKLKNELHKIQTVRNNVT